jgi:hypothetical protein
VYLRMAETILAPCFGGLEYMGLTRIFSWDSTLIASSGVEVRKDTAPMRWPK